VPALWFLPLACALTLLLRCRVGLVLEQCCRDDLPRGHDERCQWARHRRMHRLGGWLCAVSRAALSRRRHYKLHRCT
jgi:hypothetical protein